MSNIGVKIKIARFDLIEGEQFWDSEGDYTSIDQVGELIEVVKQLANCPTKTAMDILIKKAQKLVDF